MCLLKKMINWWLDRIMGAPDPYEYKYSTTPDEEPSGWVPVKSDGYTEAARKWNA